VGFAELKRKTVELFNQHNKPISPIHMVLVEKANAGLSLIPELRAETGLPVIPMAADSDKRVRASRIEPIVESGLLYLPVAAPWLDDFKRELLAFPAGHNDDQVDALVYALTRLRGDSDFDRNYLSWLRRTSANAQGLQLTNTGESRACRTIVPDPQVHRTNPRSPYVIGPADLHKARMESGFCGDCGRNCYDLSRAGIPHERVGPSRNRCKECVVKDRTGYFCSVCGEPGKAPMANCRNCGHS